MNNCLQISFLLLQNELELLVFYNSSSSCNAIHRFISVFVLGAMVRNKMTNFVLINFDWAMVTSAGLHICSTIVNGDDSHQLFCSLSEIQYVKKRRTHLFLMNIRHLEKRVMSKIMVYWLSTMGNTQIQINNYNNDNNYNKTIITDK